MLISGERSKVTFPSIKKNTLQSQQQKAIATTIPLNQTSSMHWPVFTDSGRSIGYSAEEDDRQCAYNSTRYHENV